jgi:radical SAM superfamily enzyme YgiQ (UPF0313 family)
MRPRLTLVSALSALDDALAGGSGNLAPPLGVLTLAAILRSRFDVSLIDLDFLWWQTKTEGGEDFLDRADNAIQTSRPDFLGFSTISGSYPATIRLAERSKHNLPGVPIIFGGPQASVVDTATLAAFPFVDYIVRGEADESLPLLLDTLLKGNHPGLLQGLTYRSGGRASGKVVRNQNSPPVHDLDALPAPAFDLLDYDLEERGLPIEAGRGCPFACTFWSTNDFFRRKFRLRSPERILAAMQDLNHRYGTVSFHLTHDMFTVDRKRVVDVCETLIAAGSPFEWSCSARTDCVDRELLRLMRKAGCFDIFFGIETGSQQMQKVIQKDLDMERVREIFGETDAAGLKSTASIIVGYPEETPEDLRESVRFYGDMLRYTSVEPQFNILSPLAATPMTEQFRHALVLDEQWTTISESGRAQDVEDQRMIQEHPAIFQSFYAMPSQTPRPELRRLRDFLYVGGMRCRGLLYALHLHCGNLSDVFDCWEDSAGAQPEDWYYSAEFGPALAVFAERQYGALDPAVRVAAGFYRSVLASADAPEAEESSGGSLRLDDGVRVIDCNGNIHALLSAFRSTGKPPDEASLQRKTTAVVRQLETGRGIEIFEFPPAAAELLKHARRGSEIEEAMGDFVRRGIGVPGFTSDQVVWTAIEMLAERQLLVRPQAACA